MALSEAELLAWLRKSLPFGMWVNSWKPWLWPVLEASLPAKGLSPFIHRHSDEFEMQKVPRGSQLRRREFGEGAYVDPNAEGFRRHRGGQAFSQAAAPGEQLVVRDVGKPHDAAPSPSASSAAPSESAVPLPATRSYERPELPAPPTSGPQQPQPQDPIRAISQTPATYGCRPNRAREMPAKHRVGWMPTRLAAHA